MEQTHHPQQPRYIPKEYPTGAKELLFALAMVCSAMALCNFTVFGGFNLGFALGVMATLLCSAVYLLVCGRRPTAYSAALLVLSLVIAASFARGDDGFVKFVMLGFVLTSGNLGLCLLAGQNRHAPGSAASLLDAAFALFNLGFGEMSPAYRGLSGAFRRSGPMGQKSTAVLVGVGIAVPILAIMIPLLMRADAAFEGLIDLLPDFSFAEFFTTVLLGCVTAYVLYTRGVALRHYDTATAEPARTGKGMPALTVNTVLSAVGFVYCVYLASQLAYFAGGFAGILPEEYTLAQYARRGFFEMAWLCAINLGLIALSLGLSRQNDPAPLSTRLLCLFLGIVTEFLVVTASAKMFLYIESFGLTRLRVLTQVVMLFLALTTLLVCIRLFVPKLPYMKTVILSALLLGALVSWLDVDSFVARYNVDAYLSGALEQVDVSHLGSLSDGAVPHIARLAEAASDPEVAEMARDLLDHRYRQIAEDFRGWNYVNHTAAQYLPAPELAEDMLFTE